VITARRPDGLLPGGGAEQARNGKDREQRGNAPTDNNRPRGSGFSRSSCGSKRGSSSRQNVSNKNNRKASSVSLSSFSSTTAAADGAAKQMQRSQQEAARQEAVRKAQQQRPQPQTLAKAGKTPKATGLPFDSSVV
jgi:hypothetical protein